MQFFIVTTRTHATFTARAVDNICRYFDPSEIHLIVPSDDQTEFQPLRDRKPILTVHSEREFAPHLDLAEIRQWPVNQFPDVATWYYQQFLKLSIAEHASSNEQFVVWDGDTIPYRHMRFFENGRPIFTVHSKEFHTPYFETNAKLIGVDRREDLPNVSAISQHMPVVKMWMLALLRRIEQRSGIPWPQAIRNIISHRADYSLFSEYETYFDFVRTTSANYQTIRRPWFRMGNSCTADQLMFLRHFSTFVAHENWDIARPFSFSAWTQRWREIIEAQRNP